MGGAPPAPNHTPFLEIVLNGEGGESHAISLEPLGTRPAPGTPETYSVEGANIGSITHIKARLVGIPGVSWLINEVIVHSPTSGHTHHFPLGQNLVAGGEEHVVKATEVLESSFNTSTMVSTPRTSTTELTGMFTSNHWPVTCISMSCGHWPFYPNSPTYCNAEAILANHK
jgi:hypothetical protein